MVTKIPNNFQQNLSVCSNQRQPDISSALTSLSLFSCIDAAQHIVDTKVFDNSAKKQQILQQIQNSFSEGIKYFKQGIEYYNFAEQKFATVLKPTLSKFEMQNLYITPTECLGEIINSLTYLAKIYLVKKDCSNNYAKAAAIYQYCAAFTKKHSIELSNSSNFKSGDYLTYAHDIERQYITSLKKPYMEIKKDSSDFYKLQLNTIRQHIGKKLKIIENWPIKQLDERVSAIELIYKECSDFFINNSNTDFGFINQLIQDCFNQLGQPPEGCQYSFVAFGSLGTGRMTPWSDLEFSILINKDNVIYKEYFRIVGSF